MASQTAVERAAELLNIPIKDLPPLAVQFRNRLCSEMGLCLEVCLTAFAAYAQCVEGLPCDDEAYKARPQDVHWFKHRTMAKAFP